MPVVGAITSTTLLGDQITWNRVLGTVTVLAGLATAEGRFAANGAPLAQRPVGARGRQ